MKTQEILDKHGMASGSIQKEGKTPVRVERVAQGYNPLATGRVDSKDYSKECQKLSAVLTQPNIQKSFERSC